MSYASKHLDKQGHSLYPAQLVSYLQLRFGFGERHSDFTVQESMYDFGCGRGGYTLEWAKYMNVIGIDYEEQSLNVPTIKRDLTQPEYFAPRDLVFSKSVIEHLPSAEMFLDNAFRALKRTGRVIIMVPDWKTGYKTFYDDYTHVRPYTITSLRELFDTTLWNDLEVEVFWQIAWAWEWPRLFKMIRWTRWFLPEGDVKRRMTTAALLATATKG